MIDAERAKNIAEEHPINKLSKQGLLKIDVDKELEKIYNEIKDKANSGCFCTTYFIYSCEEYFINPIIESLRSQGFKVNSRNREGNFLEISW